jgi:hypothetical protein
MVTPVVTLFLQGLSRSAAAAIELLGTAQGSLEVTQLPVPEVVLASRARPVTP